MFSTGLGTPTGNAIVPVIKVSSNSAIARRLSYMIDFDTGPVLSGERSISSLSENLLALCLQTASGTYTTKADRLGQDDFIPWKRQVSL
jgi:altronate hydrolase